MILFASGSTLVASSMWKLGVTGTYLGDYFGILMDVRRCISILQPNPKDLVLNISSTP